MRKAREKIHTNMWTNKTCMNIISLHTGINNSHFSHSKLCSCYILSFCVCVVFNCIIWYVPTFIKYCDVINKGYYWMCTWKCINSNNQHERWLSLWSLKGNLYWTFLLKISFFDAQKVLLLSLVTYISHSDRTNSSTIHLQTVNIITV